MEEEVLQFHLPSSIVSLPASEREALAGKLASLLVEDAESGQKVELRSYIASSDKGAVLLQVLELVRHHARLEEAGWGKVVLIGMGSSKTALKYVKHLSFAGKIAVDPDLHTYAAAGMGKNPDAWKGFKADGAAAERMATLTGGKVVAAKFILGSGITNAGQNGGVMCVTRDLKDIPFYYIASGSWDMPDLTRMLEVLTGQKAE